MLDIVKSRDKSLGLLPPYKEHLAQDFPRFIMKLGLPSGIPKLT